MKQLCTLEKWETLASRETRGDMVHDILRDWRAEAAEIAQLRRRVAVDAQVLSRYEEDIAKLRAQRDEMLAALKTIESRISDARCIRSLAWTAMRDQTRAAVARAEGRDE